MVFRLVQTYPTCLGEPVFRSSGGLRYHRRKKDRKVHRYWRIVGNRRTSRGPVQCHVLYPGEINESQLASREKAITVFDERDSSERPLTLYPDDRPLPDHTREHGVSIRLNALSPSVAHGIGERVGWPSNSGASFCSIPSRWPVWVLRGRQSIGRRSSPFWSPTASSIRGANGASIGIGSTTRPWPICLEEISASPPRTSCTAAMTACLSIVPRLVESCRFEIHGFAGFLRTFSSEMSASGSSFFRLGPIGSR
jgi:hypothetical protein